jgi:trehalose-phosphatase
MGIFKTGRFRRGIRMPAFFALEERKTWMPILEASSIFLFLDFDGTLTEIAPRPGDVHLSSQRRKYLQALLAIPGLSVAVISGRPIADLQRLIGLDELYYVGNHGLEWSPPGGSKSSHAIDKPVTDALQSIHNRLRPVLADRKGVYLEDKGTTLALHYRMASEDTALTVKSEFVRAVHQHQQGGLGLEILAGKEVVEAKPTAANKGDAAAYLLEQYGPEAFPVYCGDDFTDEVAFHRLDKTGLTILVAETPRPTAASFFLRSPNEVYEFLRLLIRLKNTK